MKTDPDFLREKKRSSTRIAALTAYDYPTARLLDDCGLDVILVGDSLGMVVLGHPDTTEVTMEDMIRHTSAVARGASKTWVVADMPNGSHPTPDEATSNARRLVEAGADAVKIEGGKESLPAIQAILAARIPLVGHLGMLPQRVREEGGYRIKGKTNAEAERIAADAKLLDAAGVSAIVLELVHPPLAAQISAAIATPTIGIGSGAGCDGEILVLHDVIGLFPWFRPKFAQARADVAGDIRQAASAFVAATRKTAANSDRL